MATLQKRDGRKVPFGWCLPGMSDDSHKRCFVAIGSASTRHTREAVTACSCDCHTEADRERALADATAHVQHQKEVYMTETQEKAKPKAAPKPPKDCLCGCGGQTKGGNYLPGHDSRHASMVAADAQQVPVAQRDAIYDRLPTEALKAKARYKVELAEEKAEKKAAAAAAKAAEAQSA